MPLEGEDRGLGEERAAFDEDTPGASAGAPQAAGAVPASTRQDAGDGDTSGAGLADAETPTSPTVAARAPREAPAGPTGAPPTRRARFRDRPRDWWLLALTGRDTDDAGQDSAPPREPEETSVAANGAEAVPAAEDDRTTVEQPQAPAAVSGQAARPAAPPRPSRTAARTHTQSRTSSATRARQLRGLIAAIVALFLLGLAVSHLFAGPGTAAPSSAPAASPQATGSVATAPAGPFAPVAAKPVAPLAVLGAAARLTLPREAVTLPDGHFVVADTGNSRVVILDDAGHLLRVVRRGAAPFQQPFAVAAMGTGIVVLDAARGSLDLLNADGGFIRELLHSQQLVDARGLAVGPHDRLYVANPRSNSVLVLSQAGAVAQTLTGPLSAAPGGFNQPSDVAVGGNGTIYVLDNVNDRIEALTPARTLVRQWPAPSSDTVFSVHLLALSGGRVLASDPTGALVVYGASGGQPTRVPLGGSGPSATPPQPVGLATAPHGDIVVTDARGGRLLLLSSSSLLH